MPEGMATTQTSLSHAGIRKPTRIETLHNRASLEYITKALKAIEAKKKATAKAEKAIRLNRQVNATTIALAALKLEAAAATQQAIDAKVKQETMMEESELAGRRVEEADKCVQSWRAELFLKLREIAGDTFSRAKQCVQTRNPGEPSVPINEFITELLHLLDEPKRSQILVVYHGHNRQFSETDGEGLPLQEPLYEKPEHYSPPR